MIYTTYCTSHKKWHIDQFIIIMYRRRGTFANKRPYLCSKCHKFPQAQMTHYCKGCFDNFQKPERTCTACTTLFPIDTTTNQIYWTKCKKCDAEHKANRAAILEAQQKVRIEQHNAYLAKLEQDRIEMEQKLAEEEAERSRRTSRKRSAFIGF